MPANVPYYFLFVPRMQDKSGLIHRSKAAASRKYLFNSSILHTYNPPTLVPYFAFYPLDVTPQLPYAFDYPLTSDPKVPPMTRPRHYCPTPWIDVTHPIDNLTYKFRLERTRAGGKIYVKFHKDSPAGAGAERGVLPSRSMWYDWVQAAERLLDTAQHNPHSDPASPHPIFEWNRNKRDYVAHHGEDVDKVAFAIPNLLNPALGPPYKLQRITALAKPGATLNTTQHRARNNRYAEIVITMRDVLTRIKPIYDRMQDARRMKGYDKEEVQAMLRSLEVVKSGAENLRRMAMTDTFKAPSLAPYHPTPLDVDLDSFDSDITPLSPSEQQIAADQTRQERDPEAEEARQRAFDEAQWAKIKDSMWKGAPKGDLKSPSKGGFVVVPEDK